MPNWVWKLLLTVLGEVVSRYILPMLNKQVKSQLEIILPVAEKWVAAVETNGSPGWQKQIEAAREIIDELRKDGITDVSQGMVDTAIQMAWLRLGLNTK